MNRGQEYALIHNLINRENFLSKREQKRLVGLVETYFERLPDSSRGDAPISSEQIINSNFKSMRHVRSYLKTLKQIYDQAGGNMIRFNNGLKRKPGWYPLFRVIMGINISPPPFVTFSHFDNLAIYIILAWCFFKGAQINLDQLYKIVDGLYS